MQRTKNLKLTNLERKVVSIQLTTVHRLDLITGTKGEHHYKALVWHETLTCDRGRNRKPLTISGCCHFSP